MNCEEVRNLLSALLDGQLPAAESRQVGAHLQQCAACNEELASLRFTSHLVSSVSQVRLPVDIARRVVARASLPLWQERWLALQDRVLPTQGFLARQFGRALVLIALFLLAASGPNLGRGAAILTWPAQTINAATGEMSELTAEFAQVQQRFATKAERSLSSISLSRLRPASPRSHRR